MNKILLYIAGLILIISNSIVLPSSNVDAIMYCKNYDEVYDARGNIKDSLWYKNFETNGNINKKNFLNLLSKKLNIQDITRRLALGSLKISFSHQLITAPENTSLPAQVCRVYIVTYDKNREIITSGREPQASTEPKDLLESPESPLPSEEFVSPPKETESAQELQQQPSEQKTEQKNLENPLSQETDSVVLNEQYTDSTSLSTEIIGKIEEEFLRLTSNNNYQIKSLVENTPVTRFYSFNFNNSQCTLIAMVQIVSMTLGKFFTLSFSVIDDTTQAPKAGLVESVQLDNANIIADKNLYKEARNQITKDMAKAIEAVTSEASRPAGKQ
jgi:hypothetical protein